MSDTLPPVVERLPFKEVLVVRGPMALTPEEGSRLARLAGSLVIWLRDGESLETLDEAEMRAEGWIKERLWIEECGQPCPDAPERLCVCPKGHGRGQHHSGGHLGAPLAWFDEAES